MRVVIQRVSEASVTIDGVVKSNIGEGLLVLLGIVAEDTIEDINWISGKISRLRIFNDDEGVMNRSVAELDGEVLVISQFTLHGSTKKGNRPSYLKAAHPDIAIPIYEKFKRQLEIDLGREIGSGEFGADMKVELINDGPVTLIIDSRNRE